jgi:hypothetical protein
VPWIVLCGSSVPFSEVGTKSSVFWIRQPASQPVVAASKRPAMVLETPGALQPPRRRGSFGGSAKNLPPTRQPGLISRRRASVWWLAPNILLYTTCRALLVAVLPNIKTAFFEGPGCAQHCASRHAAAIGGYFDSSAAAASFFLSAIIGACSDALGRKPFLLLTAVAAAAPLGALWLWPRNLWPFYALDCLSKALGGMSSGSVLASAYLADCYPVDQRTVIFGLLRAIGASASIASPLLGAYWHPVSSRHSDDGSSDGSDSSSGRHVMGGRYAAQCIKRGAWRMKFCRSV